MEYTYFANVFVTSHISLALMFSNYYSNNVSELIYLHVTITIPRNIQIFIQISNMSN
jgi:hypothetical protein